MYAYEQRLRAVELYIQLGKRVGATMPQRRQSLAAWIGELHSEARVRVVGKSEQPGREVPASMKRQRDLPTAPEREALQRQIEERQRDIRR